MVGERRHLKFGRVPGPDGRNVADLAAERHVDGRKRVRVDVLRLVVQLLVEEHVQPIVHALRAVVSVHLGARCPSVPPFPSPPLSLVGSTARSFVRDREAVNGDLAVRERGVTCRRPDWAGARRMTIVD